MSMDPPRFLQAGDVVRCEIEGLGRDRASRRRRLMARVTGAGNVSLAVETAGEGPAVLLVHGFPDSGNVWREQIGPLVRVRPARDRPRPARLRRTPTARRRSTPTAAWRSSPTCSPCSTPTASSARTWSATTGAPASPGCWPRCHPERVASLAALSVGHPAASRPPTLEARREGVVPAALPVPRGRGAAAAQRRRAAARVDRRPAVDAETYVADLHAPGRADRRAQLLPREPAPVARARAPRAAAGRRADARALEHRRPLPDRGRDAPLGRVRRPARGATSASRARGTGCSSTSPSTVNAPAARAPRRLSRLSES